MAEKEVYKNGVALLEEWEDVNYCEHDFKFKDEWLTDKEVVDKLNELHEENQALKSDRVRYEEECRLDIFKELHEENEQLKQQLNYIQNSITEHIKHQKTGLGQKALQEIIQDYNEWLLGHKGVEDE